MTPVAEYPGEASVLHLQKDDVALLRSIATVLFTDIVGSTERAAALGDRRWRVVLTQHHASVREQLARFGGHEIATAGDGFLAVFESPARAILCAAAIRDAIEELGLAVRCGLHLGEVERSDGTVAGIAVHIGARVAALAGANEILVSSTVRDAEAGSDFDFEDRGEHELKGMPGQWRLFVVTALPDDVEAAMHEPVPGPPRASTPDLWGRLRRSRVAQAAVGYLIVAWIVLLASNALRDALSLPSWVAPVTVLLLVLGFGVIIATAWVQSRSATAARAATGELPGAHEVDVKGLTRAVARGELPHLTWGRAVAGGVFAFALLFGLAGLYVVIKDQGRSFAPDEAIAEGAAPGIAVLPFQTSGPGLDVWREGVIDLVSTNLDGAAGLRAIDSRTILARWSERVQGSRVPDLTTALEIAEKAGAHYALLGSATALGPEIRLTADIYDVATGEKLGQAQAQGAPDSVYMLVDRLSIGVLQTILGGQAEDLPRVDLASVTTPSLPALKAFLEGEVLYRRGDFEAAIPAYQRAIVADSTFALALFRLGNAYGWSENVGSDLFGEYIGRAARYADRLPEREALLVRALVALQRGMLDGLAPLREGVRKYPDDPEMWYQLADYNNHLGAQALAPKEEEDQAFERAIALDPRFSPAYIHPIENALSRADSAAAKALLDRYGSLARGSHTYDKHWISYALVFGSSEERSRAEAMLDTLPIGDVGPVLADLFHPRFMRATEARAARAMQRPNPPPQLAVGRFFLLLEQGKLAAALEALQHPSTARTLTFDEIMILHGMGLPLPEGLLDQALAFGPADSFPTSKPYFAAAWAAEQGRWDEFQRAVARAEADAERFRAEGDSAGERFTRGMLRAMEGIAEWRRGRVDEAVTLLEVGQREATGFAFGGRNSANTAIRFTLGRIHLENGRPREALRYFLTFYDNSPTVHYYRAMAYEAAGERDQARASYEFFLDAWRDADRDPGVQKLIAEARAGLGRLGFQPRG